MTASRPRDALLRTHSKAFTRLLHKVRRGDVRAIHKARVVSRRLRELVPVLELEADTGARLARDLRRVTRDLGAIRELDVLAALIASIGEDWPPVAAALDAVRRDVLATRQRRFERAFRKGLEARLERTRRHLAKAADILDAGDARDARRWQWAVEARTARRASALVRAVEHAGPVYLPERLHEVRKAVKKLRYALELGAAASGEPRGREIRGLKRIQALLGRLHDRQVVIARLRRAQTESPRPGTADRGRERPRAARHLDGVLAALEDDCRRLHGRYVRRLASLQTIGEALRPRPGPRARRALSPGAAKAS